MSFGPPVSSKLDPQVVEDEGFPRPTPEQARATRARRRERRNRALRNNNRDGNSRTRGKFRSDTAQEPLTTRMCSVLAKCGDNSVDLNEMAEQVGADKRRVYDVKLVLEVMNQVVMASRGRIKRQIDGSEKVEEERMAKRCRIEEELKGVDAEIEKGVEMLRQGEGKDCCITRKLVESIAGGKLKGHVVAVSLLVNLQSDSAGREGCSCESVYLSVNLDDNE